MTGACLHRSATAGKSLEARQKLALLVCTCSVADQKNFISRVGREEIQTFIHIRRLSHTHSLTQTELPAHQEEESVIHTHSALHAPFPPPSLTVFCVF